MSRICDICGKGPQVGATVSHAHNVTKRVFLPNLQTVHAMIDGRKKKIKICTACLKKGTIQKAI
ncbi:MAG: 50S ribosomal protein L28 [Candidatus Delongbacteria bacterium]|nr:50S ribosomal protein L28 [Candidatus Delongbacteria bacterium]